MSLPAPARVDRRWLLWTAAILPFLILALWRTTAGPGLESDDYAQYLLHARALAEGRPYTDVGYIYSPYAHWIGPRAAPPGLPLLLAAVYWLLGPNLIVIKTLMLVFAAAFVALAGLYFARHDDLRLGLGVALLCGLSPAVVHHASQPLTDLPFAALVWAVIYTLDLPGRLSLRRILLITVLGGWLITMRTAGLVLIPALIAFTALRYRDHQLRPLVPIVAWAAALLALGAVLDFQQTSVVRLEPERMARWIQNFHISRVMTYFEPIFESHLYPFPGNFANDVFHAFTAGLMLLGLIHWVPRNFRRFGAVFAIFYGGVLLITPASQGRYLWPLLPFSVFAVLNGIRAVSDAVTRRPPLGSSVALGFAVLLTPAAMAAVVRAPEPVTLTSIPAIREVFLHLENRNRLSPIRVSFPKPRSLTLATGIPAMGPIHGRPPCLVAELARRRITHLVVGAIVPGQPAGGRLAQLAELRRDLFTRELRSGPFTVYRFRRPASAELAAADLSCGPG